MVRAVIGGLITSTLLTLIVVPVVYTFLDDIGEGVVHWWTRGGPARRRVRQEVRAGVE